MNQKIFFSILMAAFFFSPVSLATSDSKVRLLVLGDSLTEGYGVAKDSAYPKQLEKLFQKNGKNIEVYNAGSSGSTSASLKNRLNWHLKGSPKYVMIALGANDGLRGVDPKSTKKNLSVAVERIRAAGAKVILAGMKMPLNYGEDYRKAYEQVFVDLNKKYKVIYIPFLLKGVGGVKELNLADGIHPNEKGHKKIAELVFQTLKDKL